MCLNVMVNLGCYRVGSQVEFILNFLKSNTVRNTYIYTPTNIWLNVLYQLAPQQDAFGSHQQTTEH